MLQNVKRLFATLTSRAPTTSSEKKVDMDNTPEILEAKLKFFIGICLALTLTGTIFAVLYSLIFVTQPMLDSAPNDQAFFELISPIATFLTGTLSGIMIGAGKGGGKRCKEDKEKGDD